MSWIIDKATEVRQGVQDNFGLIAGGGLAYANSDPRYLFAGLGLDAARESEANSKEAARVNYEIARNQFDWRIADAKKAGISPLAAIGAPMVGGHVTPVSGAKNYAANMLQGISEQVRQGELDKIRKEEAAARILNLHADTAYKAARASELATRDRNVGQGNKLSDEAKEIVSRPGSIAPSKTSNTASAQQMEDQYGDIMGNIYGIHRFIGDSVDDLRRWVDSKVKEKERNKQKKKGLPSPPGQIFTKPYSPLK